MRRYSKGLKIKLNQFVISGVTLVTAATPRASRSSCFPPCFSLAQKAGACSTLSMGEETESTSRGLRLDESLSSVYPRVLWK